MNQLNNKQRIISYVSKAIIFSFAIIGTILSAYGGKDAFMGGKTVFMYFTIQSNIAMALVALLGACYMQKKADSKVWNVIWFVATVAITLTGVVFCFVLAPTMGLEAWNIQNVMTHVVVPVMAVFDFIYVGRYVQIDKKNAVWVIVPPILYACYAGIGYALKWEFAPGINYPYFFLNWGSPAGAFGFTGELPFMGCMWWIIVLLLFLIGVGSCYLWVIRRFGKSYLQKDGE